MAMLLPLLDDVAEDVGHGGDVDVGIVFAEDVDELPDVADGRPKPALLLSQLGLQRGEAFVEFGDDAESRPHPVRGEGGV